MKKAAKDQIENDALRDALLSAGVYTGSQRPTAVDALIEEVLGPRAALLGSRRKKRPSRKSLDPAEREQARIESVRHSRSLNQIAELLHCEGFGEFAALGVLHYAQRKIWPESIKAKSIQEREDLGASLGPLTSEQRKLIGRFIHHQAEASFDAGMRIGLMASLWMLKLLAQGAGQRAAAAKEKE